jgi:alpha-mannosidase
MESHGWEQVPCGCVVADGPHDAGSSPLGKESPLKVRVTIAAVDGALANEATCLRLHGRLNEATLRTILPSRQVGKKLREMTLLGNDRSWWFTHCKRIPLKN